MIRALMTKPLLICLLIAAVVVLTDQVSKLWVLHHLHDSEPVHWLPFGDLTLTRNYSMSFGLLGTGVLARLFLMIFPFCAAIVVAIFAYRTTSPMLAAALGLVMGGALGNAIDRLHLGWVVDFLDFSALHFPWAFNVADSAVSVGAALLIMYYLHAPNPKPAAN